MTWISKAEQWPPVGDRGINLKFNRGGVEWVHTNCLIDGCVPIACDCHLSWDDGKLGSVDEITHWENAYDLGEEWFHASRIPLNGSRIDVRLDVHYDLNRTIKEAIIFDAVYAEGRFYREPGYRAIGIDPGSNDDCTATHWRYTIKR